jgi:AraC family transcriptional regulator of arabinose operon
MRLESKHPKFRRISGAHFREGPDYSAWRANGTNDWLLIHTVSGTGRVTSGGTEMSVLAGDAVLFPPNHPHDYCTAPGFPSWEILFAHFRPPAAWRSLLDWPGQSNGFGHIHVDGEVRKRVISGLRRSTRMARSVGR